MVVSPNELIKTSAGMNQKYMFEFDGQVKGRQQFGSSLVLVLLQPDKIDDPLKLWVDGWGQARDLDPPPGVVQ